MSGFAAVFPKSLIAFAEVELWAVFLKINPNLSSTAMFAGGPVNDWTVLDWFTQSDVLQ